MADNEVVGTKIRRPMGEIVQVTVQCALPAAFGIARAVRRLGALAGAEATRSTSASPADPSKADRQLSA